MGIWIFVWRLARRHLVSLVIGNGNESMIFVRHLVGLFCSALGRTVLMVVFWIVFVCHSVTNVWPFFVICLSLFHSARWMPSTFVFPNFSLLCLVSFMFSLRVLFLLFPLFSYPEDRIPF